MHHPSIQQLLDLGSEMLLSLESGDVDTFSELLGRRGELVRSVSADFEPGTLSEDQRLELASQSSRLEAAMRETRTGLGAAVSAVSRFRSARQTYRQRPNVPKGRLNKSLHG